MGQPFVRDFWYSSVYAGSSLVVAPGQTRVTGNLLIAFFAIQPNPTSIGGSGWKAIAPKSGGSYACYTFWRWADQLNNNQIGANFGTGYGHLLVVEIEGLDQSLGDPLFVTSTDPDAPSTSTPTIPAYTVPRSLGLSFAAFAGGAANATTPVPAGMTLVKSASPSNLPSACWSYEAPASTALGPYATSGANAAWSSVGLFVADNNPAPSATPTSPKNNASLDYAADVPLVWAASDETAVVTSEVRYRKVGDATWLTQTGIVGTQWSIPAGTLPVGFNEWQVRAVDSLGPGEWSESAVFFLAKAVTVRRDASLRALVPLAADPATDVIGAQYLNTATGKVRILGSDGWADLAPLPDAAASMDVQTFTSSGTWTKPAWAKRVTVHVIGGGGGGCSNVAGGAGGGGGGYNAMPFDAALLPTTVPVTVGAGGPGAAAPATSGNGGDSSFGTYLAAGGGAAGTSTTTAANGFGALHAGAGAKSAVLADPAPLTGIVPAASQSSADNPVGPYPGGGGSSYPSGSATAGSGGKYGGGGGAVRNATSGNRSGDGAQGIVVVVTT